jgi:hypothetical protein
VATPKFKLGIAGTQFRRLVTHPYSDTYFKVLHQYSSARCGDKHYTISKCTVGWAEIKTYVPFGSQKPYGKD